MEKEGMNVILTPTEAPGAPEKLNDLAFRLILIPFFGIAIPIVTGMIHNVAFTKWQLKFSFIYTILIAFCVWEGNRYLLFSLRTYFNWFNKPVKKILALLLAISFYTIPLSSSLLVGWYHVFKKGVVDWNVVFTSTLIIMICVVFIVHVYETVFLVKDSESKMLKNEQLERARAEATLEALKNQIDPHFIFNSLNTLSHLIEENPIKARLFNDNLADVYRYILHNKGSGLVLLKEEIDFLNDYFSLLKIRFEKAVQLKIELPDALFDCYLIPPISLQILAENAIKHNEFSDSSPLKINIRMLGDELLICNQIAKKKLRKKTSNIGLRNLSERYLLTTNKKITVSRIANEFIVSLPILKIL